MKELQQRELWKSIAIKRQFSPDINTFLNALTQEEFTEFIQSRDMPLDKIEDTGRFSEVARLDPRELIVQAREEQMLKEY